MKQAHQHLSPGNTHYNFINDQINALVERWNESHPTYKRPADPKIIGDAFKRIFEYHKWISIDDIQPTIDLGLMGTYGENKGLNSETIFKWFTGYSNAKRKAELENHTAYDVKDTFIPVEQRKETRKELIFTFMEFYHSYQETKVLNPKMNHYYPVFFQWFRNLKYIDITDEKELSVVTYQADALRNIRTLFSVKPDTKETETMKSMFLDAFKLAANNNYPIEQQLNEMK